MALLTLDQISDLPQIARSAPSPRVCLLRAQIATTQQKIEMRCISESQPPPAVAQLRPVGPPMAGNRMAPASRESGDKAWIAGSLEESE